MFSSFGRKLLATPLSYIIPFLEKTGVTPNGLTIIGFLFTAVIAVVLALGYFITGGVLLILAALFDTLDGALARQTGQSSKFGAFLDSTMDRFSEGIVLIGLVYYYAAAGSGWLEVTLLGVTLLGSLMVSYTRARAEALGFECKVGLLQRPERIILLVLGLITPWMQAALWLLAIFTIVTAGQRIVEVYKQAQSEPQELSTPSADD